MNKTVKQLADELGTSKTTIANYMNSIENFRELYTEKTEKGVILISPDGCKVIVQSFQKTPQNDRKEFVQSTTNQVFADEIAFLRQQITEKDRQLAEKDKQIESLHRQNENLTTAIENTTQSLAAAQALHAGTMQKQLEEPTEEAITVVQEKKKTGFWSRWRKG